MVDFSTKLINRNEALHSKIPPELDEDEVDQIEASKPKILEMFMNDVFADDTMLERGVYVRRLGRFGKWIFNAQAIRDKIQTLLIDSFREE